jgi:hypothetical protein
LFFIFQNQIFKSIAVGFNQRIKKFNIQLALAKIEMNFWLKPKHPFHSFRWLKPTAIEKD